MTYENEIAAVTPLFPWVLIRILDRAQQIGLIHVPERQNKPSIEGIVLRIYPDSVRKGKLRECAVKVGDHVTFPHFEGLPIPALPEKTYRIVKDEVLTAVIEKEPVDVRAELERIVSSTAIPDSMIARILDRFELVDKTQVSVTTSGA